MLTLFKRRTVPVPTPLGWTLIFGILALPFVWWFRYGESFLTYTDRLATARVLVVEGWIGPEGLKAAKTEFEKGGYDLLVTSGGNPDPYSEENWQREGWTYAEGAFHQLSRLGFPAEKMIAAPSKEADRQRTYTSALAVKSYLTVSGVTPKSINVFTFGSHARRTHLVYEKAYGPGTRVGVIAWEPPRYAAGPWWKSSERSIELLVQTVGYFYEFFFNSGRKA